MSTEQQYLTIREAAELYRVTERTIRRWINAGTLVAETRGRTVRVLFPQPAATTRSAS